MYISTEDRSFYSEVASTASAQGRKAGIKVSNKSLKELSADLAAQDPKLDDASIVLLVAYRSDWEAGLQNEFTKLKAAFAGSPQTRLGLWLVDKGQTPQTPQGIEVDALTSPSSERPAKALGKKFLSKLFYGAE